MCSRAIPLPVPEHTINRGPAHFTNAEWAARDLLKVYLAAPIGAVPVVVVRTLHFGELLGSITQVGVAHPSSFPGHGFRCTVEMHPKIELDPKLVALCPERTVEYDCHPLDGVGIPAEVMHHMLYEATPCNRSRWPWLNTDAPNLSTALGAPVCYEPEHQPVIDGRRVHVNAGAACMATAYIDVICPACGLVCPEERFARDCARFCRAVRDAS